MISLDLLLDGQTARVEVSETQYAAVYNPLAQWAQQIQAQQQRRILIGVAGPPGCGKTFFSHVFSAIINQQIGYKISVVVGMDGWHYPNQLLEEKNIHTQNGLRNLKQMKGVPESFDVHSFLKFIRALPVQNELSYPLYDRNLHEPVAGKRHIGAETGIVILEGNYLLLNEEFWKDIRNSLDASMFLNAGTLLRWQTLMRRHLRGGKEAVQAIHHVRDVDMSNARRIGSPAADVNLYRDANRELHLKCELPTINQ